MSSPQHLEYKFQVNHQGNSMFIRYATQKDIDELAKNWPPGLTFIDIQHSFVDHIDIPHGVDTFQCSKGLKSITVPDSVELLYLSDNMLVELEVPHTIVCLIANNNYLQKLTFRGGDPTNLVEINLSHNLFRALGFKPPESVALLDIRRNNWESLNAISNDVLEFIRTHEDCYI